MATISLVPFQGSFIPKQRQIIYLSPSKMRNLQLQKGSPVILTCLNGELLFRCWPDPTSEELKETSEKKKTASNKKTPVSEKKAEAANIPAFAMFKHYTSFPQSINLFRDHIYEAENIIFSVDKYRPFMDTEGFLLFLKRKLSYVYMKEGMILYLKYLGWPFSLTIDSISSSFCENIDLDLEIKNISVSTFPSLEDSFNEKCIINRTFELKSSTPVSSSRIRMHSNANTNKSFYFISAKTRSVIQNPESERLRSKTKDIAGLDNEIDIIKSSLNPLLNRELTFGARGILITGPPGTGKSFLIDALRNEYENLLSLYDIKNIIDANDSGIEILKKLPRKIENESPSLILIDDFDKLCKNKELQSDLTSIIYKILNSPALILMIATAQNADSIPANLRKRGLLDEEIKLGIPSPADRAQIIEKILGTYGNDVTNDQICEISDMAHGFTGGDLNRLCGEAHLKGFEENSFEFHVSFDNLQKSLSFIKPSSMEKLSFELPNVKWSDIGGMNDVKEAVKEMVNWPLKHPEQLKKFKVVPPRGILLYGPPGCSKTMIAKALASESQLNFINIKSSQVFNMYVGESEKSVSEIFKKARAAAPCILFFDEVDSLVPVRGSTSGSSNVTDRVVTQILVEIDGIDVLEQGISVIAATNRPERIDPSLLRPGRLDRLIYVSLPDAGTRKEIFQVMLKKKPISSDIDLQYLVDKTENYTGAEISAVCLAASEFALKEGELLSAPPVSMRHFLVALGIVQPRTTQEMLDAFQNYHKKFQFKS